MWFNENDPFAAEWLRVLIAEGHVPSGVVDERSIEAVQPSDCPKTSHFFAGIGGWSYALKLAGWPEGTPVWTGSCPCQPFSSAGKRKGTKDPRHIWPVWKNLIEKCRPPIVFGEQVASPLGREWLSGVRSDLEALGYAVGSADLCAASVGAPHIRQRLFWVADTEDSNRWRKNGKNNSGRRTPEIGRSSIAGRMADSEITRQLRTVKLENDRTSNSWGSSDDFESRSKRTRNMGNADCADINRRTSIGRQSLHSEHKETYWSNFDLIPCADRKARPVEPGTFPLAYGIPARMGRLRGYGNAIVPQIAAAFIKAYIEARQ